MKPWHVMYLRPRCEKKMEEFCRMNGLSHYLPLRSETKVYQRRKVEVSKPLFPSYFFAAFDSEDRQEIMKTNYVLRIMTPPRPRLLLHELAHIRKALRVDPTLGANSAVQQGVHVRITGGPFMGVEGVVQKIKANTKVTLNVEMIGQAITFEVDRAYLEVNE